MDFNLINMVGVFVIQDGKVLLVQRKDNGKWEFPKGIINEDEKVESAVSRVMQDQLAIDGKTVQEMGSVESQDGNNISIIMYIVVESDKTLDISLSSHSDYLFVGSAKLGMLDLAESDKKFITDYQEEISKMVK